MYPIICNLLKCKCHRNDSVNFLEMSKRDVTKMIPKIYICVLIQILRYENVKYRKTICTKQIEVKTLHCNIIYFYYINILYKCVLTLIYSYWKV